jgi:undecaprenyl-diphosphatase
MPVAHSTVDQDGPRRSTLFRDALTAFATALVVIVAGFVMRGLDSAEMSLSHAVNVWHHGALAQASDLYYVALEPPWGLLLILTWAAGIWAVHRAWWVGVSFAVTVVLAWVPIALVKIIVGRPRPDPGLHEYPFLPQPLDPSFPSGHTALIAVLVVATVLLVTHTRARIVTALVGGVVVACAALFVMIDGMHYPSDALASILWAIGVTPLARRVGIAGTARFRRWRRLSSPREPR